MEKVYRQLKDILCAEVSILSPSHSKASQQRTMTEIPATGTMSSLAQVSTHLRLSHLSGRPEPLACRQWLMGCLAALGQFMSWLGERGLPLYKLLRKSNSFYWTDKTQKTLDELKVLISTPPLLASPKLGETLLLYVVATTQIVSATLVVEREEPGHICKVQKSIYYISKVISNYETRSNHVQNILYVILITKRKLLHYFESHPICVVTSYGLGENIGNRLATGRIAKWALNPMGLNITYMRNQVVSTLV
jgi:hypothetical protein